MQSMSSVSAAIRRVEMARSWIVRPSEVILGGRGPPPAAQGKLGKARADKSSRSGCPGRVLKPKCR
jgi:hypothetical protein